MEHLYRRVEGMDGELLCVKTNQVKYNLKQLSQNVHKGIFLEGLFLTFSELY